MKNFKELKVWQKGMEISRLVFSLLEELDSKKHFHLKSQLQRSAVSIPSNIAEGGSRRSEKEYFRFLEIALGSAFELETQLMILKDIQDNEKVMIDEIIGYTQEEQRMLQGFMKRINVR